MDPDRAPSLGERIRWGNVAGALALLAAVALVLVWPRLTPSEPALPPPPPEPLAVGPEEIKEADPDGEEFEGTEAQLGGGGGEESQDASNGSGDREVRRGSHGGDRGKTRAPAPAPPRRSSPRRPSRPPAVRPPPARLSPPPQPAASPAAARPAPIQPSPPPADPVDSEFGFE